MAQALEACESLKEEEKRRSAALEDSIYELREAQSTREVRRAESALRAVPRPQGPLQMTGAATRGVCFCSCAMVCCTSIERAIRQHLCMLEAGARLLKPVERALQTRRCSSSRLCEHPNCGHRLTRIWRQTSQQRWRATPT